MPISFYRKKTAGQPDAFYESGTNRYIGPTEFGKGAGFTEVKEPNPGVAPGGSTGSSIADNPILKYIQENINQPARTQYEKAVTERANQPSQTDIFKKAREEAGLPAIEQDRANINAKVQQFKQTLQELEDSLLAGQKGLEGQGRGIPLSLIRGQQEKLATQSALEKLPITRTLEALTGQGTLLENQYSNMSDYANRLAAARYGDVTAAGKLAEERVAFEAGLAKPLTESALKILEEQQKPKVGFTLGKNQVRYEYDANGVLKPVGTTPSVGGGGNVTPYSSVKTTLEQSRGDDFGSAINPSNLPGQGYVNTDVYKEQRNLAKDKTTFDKNYSYLLNPNDPTAKAFIKTPVLTETAKKAQQRTEVAGQLQNVAGTDGFVSPNDWQLAKKAFVQAGYGTPADFIKNFSIFKNPDNPDYSD